MEQMLSEWHRPCKRSSLFSFFSFPPDTRPPSPSRPLNCPAMGVTWRATWPGEVQAPRVRLRDPPPHWARPKRAAPGPLASSSTRGAVQQRRADPAAQGQPALPPPGMGGPVSPPVMRAPLEPVAPVAPAVRPQLPLLVRLAVAGLWPERLLGRVAALAAEARAYAAMARPINLAPSIALTLVGAGAGAPAGWGAALSTPAVWGVAAASAAISFGSCVVNDYFDRAADALNAPGKPLPSGAVPPDGALLFGGGLYFCVLIGAAALESAALRGIVAGSVAITLAYTPVLKRLPLVKNAAVAAVIALAPAAGALAAACAGPGAAGALGAAARAGGGAATTPTLLLPPAVARTVAFVFCAIVGREVLMDVGDVAGDAAAGVATLPVVAGARAGLVASALALAAAASLLVGGIVNAQGAARAAQAAAAVGVAPALGAAAVALAAALACAALVSPPLRALFGGPAGRTRAALGPGIDGLLAPVGAGCLLLAGLA